MGSLVSRLKRRILLRERTQDTTSHRCVSKSTRTETGAPTCTPSWPPGHTGQSLTHTMDPHNKWKKHFFIPFLQPGPWRKTLALRGNRLDGRQQTSPQRENTFSSVGQTTSDAATPLCPLGMKAATKNVTSAAPQNVLERQRQPVNLPRTWSRATAT